jgi:DNA polymerase-3 subunit delta'
VFRRVAARVDGNGATVIATVEELLGLVSSSLSPLAARQAEEARALEERVAVTGERGAGRKAMQDRHKRELRRHRRDELGAGLAALASAYRDGLAEGSIHDPAAAVAAVEAVHEAFEALERNPNEALLLQDLLLRLPPA